ncbi:MAG: MoaD/ThiS family protein [Cognatishimia sp.]|uniref:MoaD/ThiS family protein n=1 Tax=Cognatishimia sp. TaxID=2211648 RepID=UPI0040580108
MRPLVQVHLWAGLRRLADGKEVVAVQAATIGQMLDALAQAYPGLADYLEDNVSVSVDGRIMATDLTHPLSADSEIYLMQRLRGG